jgi:mono/diheme cytochrome c family protein
MFWVVAMFVNIGMWFERFVIIVTSLSRDFLPSSGVTSPRRGSTSSRFVGSFGLFFTLFLLFCRFLPMVAIAERRFPCRVRLDPRRTSTMADSTKRSDELRVNGVLVEFEDPKTLMKAAETCRDDGWKDWDAHTPFPVHGLDDAMGIRPTILPIVVLGAGLTGLGLAVLMQWWMNAVDYPYLISGKPDFSLPANVPVIFELTVLLSAFACFFGVLIFNKLPNFWNPTQNSERFLRATADRFYIWFDAKDPKFASSLSNGYFDKLGGSFTEEVADDDSSSALPKPFLGIGITVVILSWVPLLYFMVAKHTTSETPPFHVVFDLDDQQHVRAQAFSKFFADGSGNRLPVEGTVARGELRTDDHLHAGKLPGQGEGEFAATFPQQIEVNAELLRRGHERYDIYCATCHGYTGHGDGMVHRRASLLGSTQGTAWVPPTSIHTEAVMAQPVGYLYDVVKNGIRNMPGYGHQIPVEDRWAIVLYLKALQRAEAVPFDELSPEDQQKLGMK